MKLSIIIPVYNNAAFVERCIKSLEMSPEAEFILVDDGSTDGTTDILKNYEGVERTGTNIRILFKKHGGVSYARNCGLLASKGDYITFLDADDEEAPGGTETLLKVINAMAGENVIQLNHYRCHGGTCRIEPRYYVRQGFYELVHLPPKWATVWNKLYKRAFVEDEDIFFPLGQQFDEDRQFNLECLKRTGGIACVEAVAMKKHFDNNESLCHTFSILKARNALAALADQLDEAESVEYNRLILKCIKMHLNSKKFEEVFGGGL